jgi:transposase
LEQAVGGLLGEELAERKTWRHLNFFQHQAYLTARVPRVPRVRCDKCGIKTVDVPWARPDSGFTLLFEAMLMAMIPAMPVAAVARNVGEHDTRLWRVVHYYVEQGRERADMSSVTRVAIDETAARRGHNYIRLFVDIDQARVLFATGPRWRDGCRVRRRPDCSWRRS